VSTLQQRVAGAARAYKDALEELRVDQLLKKDSGSFMFDLLLDVIGLAVISNASKALRHLRGAPAALAEYTSDIPAVTAELQRASDKRIELIAREKERLSAKLKHFEDSGVGKLGTQWNVEKHNLLDLDKIDTKAFWVQLPAGKRLGLYRRGHVEHDNGLLGQVLTRDADHRPFKFERYVPDDLIDTAIQMHTAKWSEPPSDRLRDGPEWSALPGAAP
jgi:hypothetical protein